MEMAQRQAYLAALGIDIWVSRANLPGALPSLSEFEYEEPLVYAEELAYTEEMGEPASQLESRVKDQAPSNLLQNNDEPEIATVNAPQTVQGTATAQGPRFALNFCHVPGAWLVCDLSQLDAPDFNQKEYILLKNILKALHLSEEVGNRAVFNWPIQLGPRDHLRNFPQGKEEAKTAVMRTLNARLQREPEALILVFGKVATDYLLPIAQFEDVRGKVQHWPMQKAHLIATESLTDMLQQPSRKKVVWRDLQAYFSLQTS